MRWAALLVLGMVAACAPAPENPTVDPSQYTRLMISGDPGLTGTFDPSLVVPTSSSTGAMSYSTLDWFLDGNSDLVRRVNTAIATTTDGGTSWTHDAVVAPSYEITLTAPDLTLCGTAQCDGWMISEVSALVDDATDPNANARWKLFAHQYFIYPPGEAAGTGLQRILGGITMRTAPSPTGPWSGESYALNWDLSPPEISATTNISNLPGDVGECLVLSEPGIEVLDGDLEMLFACPYLNGADVEIRIVHLRSVDHGASFQAVGTVLQPDDAIAYGGTHFSAPELIVDGDRTLLIVTPETDALYQGCVVFEFDRMSSTVGAQLEFLPTLDDRFGGACSWDAGAPGILMSQVFLEGDPVDPFRLFATGVVP